MGENKFLNSQVSTIFEKYAKSNFTIIGENLVLEAMQKENIFQIPDEYTPFLMKKIAKLTGGKYYLIPIIVNDNRYSNVEFQYYFYDLYEDKLICKIKAEIIDYNQYYNLPSAFELGIPNLIIEKATQKVFIKLNHYLNVKK
jgi:hypothetical protein